MSDGSKTTKTFWSKLSFGPKHPKRTKTITNREGAWGCPRDAAADDGWRAPFRDQCSRLGAMFKLLMRNNSFRFGHACPPTRIAHNVWRASPWQPRPPKDSGIVPAGDCLYGQRTDIGNCPRALLRRAGGYSRTSGRAVPPLARTMAAALGCDILHGSFTQIQCETRYEVRKRHFGRVVKAPAC